MAERAVMQAARTGLASPAAPAAPGGREVATVLVALGRERASRLLAHFEPHEVAALRAIGSGPGSVGGRLPNVSAAELTGIVDRFEEAFETGAGVVGASSSFAAILAQTALPEGAPEASSPAPAPAADTQERRRRWAAVAEGSNEDLVAWLEDENEAVAALVLARLPSRRSAELLTLLAPETCSAVVGALPHVDAGPEAEDIVLDLIEAELADAGTGGEETQSLLADIVNELDPQMGETVTRRLAETLSPQQMNGISSRIFRFEDVARLDASARSTLLGDEPADRIVLALRDADAALKESVLSSLGQRMRRMVESDLASAMPAKPDAARAARRDIAGRAVALAREGRLDLPER